jgi:transposase
MQTVADRPETPNAIRTDLGAIFVSLELSRSTWLITSLSPDGGEKMSKLAVQAAMSPGYWGALRNFGRKRGRGRGRSLQGTYPEILADEVITHPQIWSADFGCFTPRC